MRVRTTNAKANESQSSNDTLYLPFASATAYRQGRGYRRRPHTLVHVRYVSINQKRRIISLKIIHTSYRNILSGEYPVDLPFENPFFEYPLRKNILLSSYPLSTLFPAFSCHYYFPSTVVFYMYMYVINFLILKQNHIMSSHTTAVDYNFPV